MQKPVLFTRNATGLVRNISPLTILLANLGEIGFGTTLLLINYENQFFAGGNAVYAVLLFTAVVMFEALIYYHVIKTVGRTGGDYVWISRNLGPVLGGAVTLGFVFTGIPFIAISLAWLWQLSLGPSATVIGQVSPGSSSIVSAITSIASSTFSFNSFNIAVVSLVILAIVIAIDFVSPKYGYVMLASFVVIALIGTIMMVGVYVGVSSTAIRTAVSSYLGTFASPSTSLSGAASSYTGPQFSWTGILFLLPFVAYSMPWINNASAFSGELKNLKRSSITGTFIPLLVSGGLLAGFFAMYYGVLGYNAALSSTGSNYLNMLTVATIAMGGNASYIWIMNIAFAFWYLASLQQTILAISRYALGMSFDRIIPIQLSKVSDRFHSPVATLGLAFALAVPMILIASYENWLSIFSTSAMGMVFFAFMGITAIYYAYRKRSSLGATGGALAVSGVIVAVFFFMLAYLYLAYPAYYAFGTNNDISLAIVAFFWILGALLYPISKMYYGGKGIDLSLAFKELPPE